jgi:hypothetical protein
LQTERPEPDGATAWANGEGFRHHKAACRRNHSKLHLDYARAIMLAGVTAEAGLRPSEFQHDLKSPFRIAVIPERIIQLATNGVI